MTDSLLRVVNLSKHFGSLAALQAVTFSLAPGEIVGLFGMQERAVLLDGRLTIESECGQGTAVFVEIPLRVAAEV